MLGIFDIEMILLVYFVANIVGMIMIHNALCDLASAIDNNTEQIELVHKSIRYLNDEPFWKEVKL